MKYIGSILILFLSLVSLLRGEDYFLIDKSGISGVSEFESKWFSKHLKIMEEPSLLKVKDGDSVYRFLLLPTWGKPIAVRLTITGEEGVLVAKRLSGQGGYDPGKLIENETIKLQKAQLKEFKALFEKVNFFQEKTQDETQGNDGAEWIFEAVENGKNHIIDRWSPDYETKKRHLEDYIKLCEWIYRTSPLKGDALNKGSVEVARVSKQK